LEAFSKVT